MEDPLWLIIAVKVLVWALYVLACFAIDFFFGVAKEKRLRSALMWGTGIWVANQLLSYFDLV